MARALVGKSSCLTLSRDEHTGEQTYKPVVDTITTRPSELYHLSYGIDDDSNGTIDRYDHLSTTGAHPFYVQGENAFVNAADLKLGDDFRLADGRSAEIAKTLRALLASQSAPKRRRRSPRRSNGRTSSESKNCSKRLSRSARHKRRAAIAMGRNASGLNREIAHPLSSTLDPLSHHSLQPRFDPAAREMLYTKGLNDALDADGLRYGIAGAAILMINAADEPCFARAISSRMRAANARWQTDDITVACISLGYSNC